MTTENQFTPEHAAYSQLREEKWELLSEAARRVFEMAEVEPYMMNLESSYSYQIDRELDEAMEEMHLAAVEMSDQDCALFAMFRRSALAAAASIDRHDRAKLVGFRGKYRGALHYFYIDVSAIVEDILQKKKVEAARQRKPARREPEDFPDIIPF